MRLLEFASADDLLKLWQIVSQNVFQAVEKERREAEEAQRLDVSKPKRSTAVQSPSRSVSGVKAVRPKAVKPQVSKPQVANPQVVKPQASKTQATALRSVSNQKLSQKTKQPRTQQPMMPRTATVQPTRRTPQVAPEISQQQHLATVSRKINPNDFQI